MLSIFFATTIIRKQAKRWNNIVSHLSTPLVQNQRLLRRNCKGRKRRVRRKLNLVYVSFRAMRETLFNKWVSGKRRPSKPPSVRDKEKESSFGLWRPLRDGGGDDFNILHNWFDCNAAVSRRKGEEGGPFGLYLSLQRGHQQTGLVEEGRGRQAVRDSARESPRRWPMPCC